MRGVHVVDLLPGRLDVGSSPHARGPLARSLRSCPSAWIIPACAGSTERILSPLTALQDHPRMRGVHLLSPSRLICQVGSSPHARGPPCKFVQAAIEEGIIPACAGSTPSFSSRGRHPGDHPRMRGVHLAMRL